MNIDDLTARFSRDPDDFALGCDLALLVMDSDAPMADRVSALRMLDIHDGCELPSYSEADVLRYVRNLGL